MIRQDADKVFFQNQPDQRQLANLLDEGFDVTFGDAHGDKFFWFADPKQHMRERFGLQQEVLVVYSPQSVSDARILTAIEQISRKPDFRHRLDKVLVLVIHHGEADQTATLLAGDTDRAIVSIAAPDLISTSRGSLFLRSRIAARFGRIDLLGMSSPIGSDKYFFGRDILVQELVQSCTIKLQNVGLFGLRKTGKTSVMHAVRRRLDAQQTLSEYIDCHSPGIHAARWWQALQNIVERLEQRLKNQYRRSASLQLGYSQSNCGTRFSADIAKLLAQSSGTVALLLDEIEYITPGLSGPLGRHWDEDFLPFWQTIRAAHHELSGRIVFIVAGVNPLAVENTSFAGLPNPIFQLAQPRYLTPFPEDSVRKMLRFFGRYSGISFDEATIPYLTTQFGGHPFLIRLAASEVWNRTNVDDPEKLTRISINDFKTYSVEIRERLRQPIKDILLSLIWWYPEEYQLLQVLAAGDESFVKEYLDAQPTSLVRFANYGLLKPGSTEFSIGDIQVFINAHGETYKAELSPFARSEISPELLPEVPDLHALGELFEKRCEVETTLRRAIIVYLGVHRTWNDDEVAKDIIKGLKRRADRADPKALFVGKKPKDVMQDLYTLDLKNIILENWSVLGPLFDGNKQRFEMNMDTINVARRHDSHTKPVSKDAMTDFLNSYGWLTRHLAKVPQ